jgi:hypothetical protein
MQTGFQNPEKRSSFSIWMQYWLGAAVATLTLWNCLAAVPPAGPENRRLPVDTIWAGIQCGCEAREPLVRWLADQNQLTAAVAATGSAALQSQLARHPVDWTRHGILWIYMGLKPSGGYALSLAGSSATVTEGVVTITVQWRQPRPGSVVTQQLTSPCLLLSMVREGFHTIQIKDEAGQVRASLKTDNE